MATFDSQQSNMQFFTSLLARRNAKLKMLN